MFSQQDTTITLDQHNVPFQYIIFGSKHSLDTDIMLWIPENLTNLPRHKYVQWGTSLDKQLPFNDPNTCFGHWDDHSLKWVQKGSELAETNNAILSTFTNHQAQQMFSGLSWSMLERNPTNKVLVAVRGVVGKTARCSINRDSLQQLLINTLPTVDPCYYNLIFAGNCANKQLRNKLCRRLASSCETEIIPQLLDMIDCSVPYRPLVRSVLKMETLGARLAFLKHLDFRDLQWKDNIVDSLKFIAFQLGQASALLEGTELYDKHLIADYYPTLRNALVRSSDIEQSVSGLEEHRQYFVSQVVEWAGDKLDMCES